MRTRPSLVTMLAVAGVLPPLSAASAGAAQVLRLAMVLWWLQPDGHAERVAGNGMDRGTGAGREVR
jgi:hypothetical protein